MPEQTPQHYRKGGGLLACGGGAIHPPAVARRGEWVRDGKERKYAQTMQTDDPAKMHPFFIHPGFGQYSNKIQLKFKFIEVRKKLCCIFVLVPLASGTEHTHTHKGIHTNTHTNKRTQTHTHTSTREGLGPPAYGGPRRPMALYGRLLLSLYDAAALYQRAISAAPRRRADEQTDRQTVELKGKG